LDIKHCKFYYGDDYRVVEDLVIDSDMGQIDYVVIKANADVEQSCLRVLGGGISFGWRLIQERRFAFRL
jgi:hypothetical protein